ncbi:hypothetical protein Tco_1410714 [Tanacetum coccineum]
MRIGICGGLQEFSYDLSLEIDRYAVLGDVRYGVLVMARIRRIFLIDTVYLLGSVPEPFSFSVLRRLGSIFTLVYAADQKLKKAFAKSFSSEVENFTNWKKRFMCHILGIEPQFENIIKNGPFIPMIAGQRKPEGQWTGDERRAANLDQRLKSLIVSVLLDDQMNFVINCLTAKSTWDDLIMYHEGPFDVKESRVMNLKLCYNTFKFKEGKTLTQTFTSYKALMNELVNDGIKLSKLKINAGFINGLPKKWLSFCQSLRNTNHMKDFELASLFGKLKYEENLIDWIYETKKNKSLISATSLSTAFISTSIVQDFQDYPDYEEDTRSSHEYLNDLEEEYQARALLSKSKRFFKKALKGSAVQKQLTKLNATNVARKVILQKAAGQKLQFPHIKEVSSDDNEMVEVKLLMALAEENDAISKKGARNGKLMKISMRKKRIMGVGQLTEDLSSSGQKDLVFVKSSADDTKVSIPSVERPWLSEAEGFTLPNHDTGRILLAESQRNTIDPSVAVIDSSATDYDSTDESSVCSTPLPLLKKLDGVEPVSGPKTIKSILRSNSTFKAETLKGIIINEPSSAPAKSNKSSLASKVNSAPAGKLKSVKIKDDPPLAIVMKELNDLKLQIKHVSASQMFRIISLRRGIKPRNPQHVIKSYETCGSTVHTTTDHNDIKWFRRGEELQAKKAEALKSTKAESTNANRSKTPTKSINQLCDAKYVVYFDEKRGTLLNSIKKVIMIAPRVRDVYVLDMTSSTQESCYFAKASVEN